MMHSDVQALLGAGGSSSRVLVECSCSRPLMSTAIIFSRPAQRTGWRLPLSVLSAEGWGVQFDSWNMTPQCNEMQCNAYIRADTQTRAHIRVLAREHMHANRRTHSRHTHTRIHTYATHTADALRPRHICIHFFGINNARPFSLIDEWVIPKGLHSNSGLIRRLAQEVFYNSRFGTLSRSKTVMLSCSRHYWLNRRTEI